MNNIAQHVLHDYAGRNSSGYIGYSSDAIDDNNDDSNKDDDDAGDSFWDKEFDHCKLVLCTEDALALYYNNYIYK